MEKELVFASFNRGKYEEVVEIFSEDGYKLRSLESYQAPCPDETGCSFVENALIKAYSAAKHTGLPVIADDSGLVVPALGGDPGVYSARYSGDKATDGANNALLLENLQGVHDRHAYYFCALVFVRHPTDPVPIICQGRWDGKILSSPEGEMGFGYDPLFWIASEQCTVASMPVANKTRLSHRGKALRQMLRELNAMDWPSLQAIKEAV